MLLVYSNRRNGAEQSRGPVERVEKIKGAETLVSATTDPRTLRVSFFCRESDTSKSEVVCNAHCTEVGKIDVEYLYHEQQVRTIPGGPWARPHEIKMEPTNALMAEIELGVMYELWSAFRGVIRLGSNVSEREREGFGAAL